MKLWKWIVGLLAMLGGAAAVASTQKKKEHGKKVKENQNKIKKVQVKTKKVQADKKVVQDKITQQKKVINKTKAKVKPTITERSQKGMMLPRKGETTLKASGGSVKKKKYAYGGRVAKSSAEKS